MLSRSILYVGGKRFFTIYPTDVKKKNQSGFVFSSAGDLF